MKCICKVNFKIFVVLVIICATKVNGATRFKRQDFVFPDQLDQIWSSTNPPTSPTSTSSPIFSTPAPDNSITPTTPSANNNNSNGLRTTPTPQFLLCMKTCPATSEYNPICGTDQFIYHNEQRLNCAQRCGSDVQMAGRGNCLSLFGQSAGRW